MHNTLVSSTLSWPYYLCVRNNLNLYLAVVATSNSTEKFWEEGGKGDKPFWKVCVIVEGDQRALEVGILCGNNVQLFTTHVLFNFLK